MISNRKLFCFLILTVTMFSFMGFAHHNEKLRVENYENLNNLKKSSSPEILSMVNVRHIGSASNQIQDGLLFTYDDRNAKSVRIAGNFSSWKPVSMTRSKYGIWYYFKKTDSDEKAYSYKYLVDGTWTKDPKNALKTNDNASSYVSITQIAGKRLFKHITYKILSKDTVEFRFYRPNAKFISLVGDFNNWNPENDLMVKDKDGIWRLTKKLSPGKTYRYKFYIDGEWEIDTFNENSGSSPLGELCSLLVLP